MLTIYTLHRSHIYVLDRQINGRQKRVNYLHTTQKSYIRAGQTIQWPTEKSQLSTHYIEVIHTCWTDNSMADRKELSIYTLHRSHTYVQDRQFNGQNKKDKKSLKMSEVIRSHRWKKDRQHNGQNKKDKKSLKMSKR